MILDGARFKFQDEVGAAKKIFNRIVKPETKLGAGVEVRNDFGWSRRVEERNDFGWSRIQIPSRSRSWKKIFCRIIKPETTLGAGLECGMILDGAGFESVIFSRIIKPETKLGSGMEDRKDFGWSRIRIPRRSRSSKESFLGGWSRGWSRIRKIFLQ